MRLGELLALNVEDVNLERKEIRINKSLHRIKGKDVITEPKTPKSRRTVTIPSFLAEDIEDYISTIYEADPKDRLIPITKTFLEKEIKRGIHLSGVKNIHIHCLRHYDERGPIEVRITHDMIEIISHPGPDKSVTIEGLKAYKVYSRRYRNRRIGDFLKELHLTEGRNTGFKKILDAIKANGFPLPEFETDEYHDYFVSRFFIHDGFYDSFAETFSGDETKRPDSTTTKTTIKITTKTTTKREKTELVIGLIRENPEISVSDVALKLNISQDGARYHLNKLKKQGVIHHEGPTNDGRWIIDIPV